MSIITKTIKGNVIVQMVTNGETSEERINSISEQLVPSANALRKALGIIKQASQKLEVDEEGTPSTNANGIKTTVSYTFEVSPEEALKILQDIDSEGNTESFDRKKGLYLDKLSSLGNTSLGELQGNAKVQALRALRPFSFHGYSWQINFVIADGDSNSVNVIHSKKHYRLEDFLQASIEKRLSKYPIKWIAKSSDQDPGKETGGDENKKSQKSS